MRNLRLKRKRIYLQARNIVLNLRKIHSRKPGFKNLVYLLCSGKSKLFTKITKRYFGRKYYRHSLLTKG